MTNNSAKALEKSTKTANAIILNFGFNLFFTVSKIARGRKEEEEEERTKKKERNFLMLRKSNLFFFSLSTFNNRELVVSSS